MDFVGIGTGHTAIHLPGTYETRLFTPRLRFTRKEQFVTVGENTDTIAIASPAFYGAPTLFAWTGESALDAAAWVDLVPTGRPNTWTWAEDIETQAIEIDGYTATVTTFTANCRYDTLVDPDDCRFPSPAFEGALYIWHGAQGAVITIDTSEPMTFTATADGPVFNTYWAETVQPILDSIEFIDR